MEEFFKNLSNAIQQGVGSIQRSADELAHAKGVVPKERLQKEAAKRGHLYAIEDTGDLPIDLAENYNRLGKVLDMYETAPSMKDKIKVLDESRRRLKGTPGVDMWFNNLYNVTNEIGSGKGPMTEANLPGVIDGHRQWLNAAYNKYFRKY